MTDEPWPWFAQRWKLAGPPPVDPHLRHPHQRLELELSLPSEDPPTASDLGAEAASEWAEQTAMRIVAAMPKHVTMNYENWRLLRLRITNLLLDNLPPRED